MDFKEEVKREFDGYKRGIEDYGETKEGIFGHYLWIVKCWHNTKNKIANPVNHWTGEPLKESTLKGYRYSIKSWEASVRTRKMAIQMLIAHGLIGKTRPKSWPGNVVLLSDFRAKREDREALKALMEEG